MLAEALGLPGEPSEDCEALHMYAARFLRGGGKVSLTEWGRLSMAEQTVLAVQGDRLRAGAVVDLAEAIRSEEGLAAVAAELDGGDSLVNLKLEEFAQRLAQRGMTRT